MVRKPLQKQLSKAAVAEQAAVDISQLADCVEEVRIAALDSDAGPADPLDYAALMGRFVTARDRMPPLYLEAVYEPFLASMRDLGRNGFVQVLLSDPARERAGGLMLDIAQAILQNGERYEDRATDAFQEVISDLYDGFLSAEDRIGVEPPDRGTIPPLVKWGKPSFGPYTWTVAATEIFDVEAGIVSLPPANTRGGLLAWSALGHETAGHDILHADTGLQPELMMKVFTALSSADVGNILPGYWADRIDETASDVMGILNMGPAAGIGLIGYFRGLNAAFTGVPRLRNSGPSGDVHPADILRGFLAAGVVRHLEFTGAAAWADAILEETKSDVTTIRIAGQTISPAQAEESADIVAKTIATERLASLEQHSLCEIQNWRDTDQQRVADLRLLLSRASDLPQALGAGMYAAHAVAAAVTAALAGDGPITVIFDRMKSLLKMMHDVNASWGPLFVVHPGNLVIHYTYGRHDESEPPLPSASRE